jgi:hypothetical protein
MMTKYIVVDLDGTLCDCSHRVSLAQAGQWDEFHSLCKDDKPYDPVVRLINVMDRNGFMIMALSGRSDVQLKTTQEWFVKWGVAMPEVLLLRPKDDFRPDIELKIAMLEYFFGGKDKVLSNVVFCLDDRDKVVEGLRNYGLTVFQTREGDY